MRQEALLESPGAERDRAKNLRDIAEYLFGPPGSLTQQRWDSLLDWPPDVFAVCGFLLKETGSYVWAADLSVRGALRHARGDRNLKQLALEWVSRAVGQSKPPSENWARISGAWSAVWNALDKDANFLREAASKPTMELVEQLLLLFTVADETARDLRVLRTYRKSGDDREVVRSFALRALAYQAAGESLSRLENERVQVLTKLCTPKPGITIRSLSRYMALDFSEVDSKWVNAPAFAVNRRGARKKPHHGSLDLLMLPWPLKSESGAFSEAEESSATHFSYDPGPLEFEIAGQRWEFEKLLDRVIENAQGRVPFLDGVVLPELATNKDEFSVALGVCARRDVPLLVAGVRLRGATGAENVVRMAIRTPDGWIVHEQSKHHRWFLDRDQVRMYGLGSQLPSSPGYWEDCAIPPRSLRFIRVRTGLTFCPLICEDLAREEPAGDLVRAVGPTLVVALLLDGPQLRLRWPARHATVLAGDPGCTVLTLTSFGLVDRAVPPPDTKRSRAVALWREPKSPMPREIELHEGDVGIILTAAIDREPGVTLDGRSDEGFTTFLSLVNVQGVEAPKGRPAPVSRLKPLPPADPAEYDLLTPLVEILVRSDATRKEAQTLIAEYAGHVRDAAAAKGKRLKAAPQERWAGLASHFPVAGKPSDRGGNGGQTAMFAFLVGWARWTKSGGGLRDEA